MWKWLSSLAVLAMLALATTSSGQDISDWGDYGYDGPYSEDFSRPSVWGRVEYLLWFSEGRELPALASTSPAGTPQGQAGVIAPGGTADILFGNDGVGRGMRSGYRATLGAALDQERIWNVETRFFQVEQSQANANLTVDNGSILARPFFRTDPNPVFTGEDAVLLTFPGLTRDGQLSIQDHNDFLSGDVYARAICWDNGSHRFDALAGYQYSRLDNSLNIRSRQVVINAPPLAPPPTIIEVHDQFDTQNRFHGAQLGVGWTCYTEQLSLEVIGRMGFGNNYERLYIHGTTSLTPEGTNNTTTSDGGFLASLNAGTYNRNRFVFVPEVDANLAYHLNENVSFMLGYTFVYWNRVALAGGNVDRTVNVLRLTGVNAGEVRPTAFFNDTDFWLMGLNLGAEFRF